AVRRERREELAQVLQQLRLVLVDPDRGRGVPREDGDRPLGDTGRGDDALDVIGDVDELQRVDCLIAQEAPRDTEWPAGRWQVDKIRRDRNVRHAGRGCATTVLGYVVYRGSHVSSPPPEAPSRANRCPLSSSAMRSATRRPETMAVGTPVPGCVLAPTKYRFW